MRRLLTLTVVVLLAGCEGLLTGPRPDPSTLPPGTITPPPTTQEEPCVPVGQQPVAKLLRVSNHEYQQMISDVLGVEVPDTAFARWTPVAAVYGFDTMSEQRLDAQALTSQLETAALLSNLVLTTPALTQHCPTPATAATPVCTVKVGYSSQTDFSDSQDRDCWAYVDSAGAAMAFDNTRSLWRKLPDENALIWANGMHPGSTVDPVLKWTGPLDGTVTLTGRFADADPGGGDGVVATIRRAGTQVWTRSIANGGPEATFSLTLPVTRGDVFEFTINRGGNPSYDTTAFSVALSYAPTPLKAAWSWDNCVGPLVGRLASRAFRRPVRAEELADYRKLFEDNRQGAAAAGFAEPVDEALNDVVQAVVLSPNFIFKPELIPAGLDPNEKAFGVASRLALFFRGSVADEPLWQLAGTGQLSTREQVRAQAARLLDAEPERFTRNFAGQWLDFRDVADVGPLTSALQAETSGVFKAVLTSGLPPQRLMRPGFTFADPSLAYHYGLAYPPNGMGGVEQITTTQRGGLLQNGGLLIHTATGSEFRRPIHRGLWTLTRLLCRSLPRLDAATLQEIQASVGAIDRSLPLSAQMELHRSSGARCSGCHSLIDPIGLALEKYDKQGLWRDAYPNGAPITNSLLLDGAPVRDPNELSEVVENSPEFKACVTKQMLTFALNRGLAEDELCVPRQLSTEADGGTPSLSTLTLEAWLEAQQLTGSTP